jgi:tetratricopeptide (TPR) repeat protein
MMAVGPAFPSTPRPTGRDALERANAALDTGRPQEAERIARELLKSDPRHLRALYVLGCALLMQGRAEDALAPLEAAGRGKRDPDFETVLAVALRRVGRAEDALSRLKRVIKRHPQHVAALREVGALLLAMERDDEAIDILQRGLALAPMAPELSFELGYALLRRRDCARAKIAFARAVEISPNAPEALFGIAKAHQEVGENEAATAYLRRYLVLRPRDANAWLTLGQCLLELGQRDAGYECFRTIARSRPERYAEVLGALVRSGRGRFWLRPSRAAQFLRVRGKPG